MSSQAALDLPPWTARLLSELEAADRRAEAVAGGLTAVQLNWRPAPHVWSIGQCLEHLRTGNEIVSRAIADALDGHPRRPVDQIRLGWLSAWFLRTYIAANPGGTRAKAPRKIEPAPEVGAAVLEGFLRSTAAARHLALRASGYDVNRIRYPNPFIPLLRFTVGMGLEIIAKHAGRHLLQAEGVRSVPGFPAQ